MDAEATRVIREELHSGEALIWAGQPRLDYKRFLGFLYMLLLPLIYPFRTSDKARILVGTIVWCAFVFVFLIADLRSGPDCYALTDQRAISIRPYKLRRRRVRYANLVAMPQQVPSPIRVGLLGSVKFAGDYDDGKPVTFSNIEESGRVAQLALEAQRKLLAALDQDIGAKR